MEAQAPTVQQGWPLLPVNQTGTSYSIQAQDRPQPPQLSPVFQTPHWPYGAVPLWYWQSDNRTSTAVLPHLQATQKGNLARPHSRSPQAVRKPEGPAMHCHLHRGDWNFHLTNEKKKKSSARLMPQNQLYGTGPLPSPTAWSPDQHHAAMLADVSRHFLGRTEGRGLEYSTGKNPNGESWNRTRCLSFSKRTP